MITNEFVDAHRDLTVANQKLGQAGLVLFVRDQFSDQGTVEWLDPKSGLVITEDEAIQNIAISPTRFGVICQVVNPRNPDERVYVIGDAKGGDNYAEELPTRWTSDRSVEIEQGTPEYLETIFDLMQNRGGPERELGLQLEIAHEKTQLHYVFVRSRLEDTPNGQMFNYSGNFFDLSDTE